jgi:hypothetical protein
MDGADLMKGQDVFKNLGHYWKGILAFIVPGATSLTVAITAGSDGGSHITQTEWIGAILTCVITSAAVTAKGNAAKKE